MEIALEIGIGLLVGVVLGALGGGGGIITVPALVYLLHQPPALATTTSLVIVGITGLAAVVQHARAGRVRWADGWAFGVLGAGGAVLGARVSAVADPGWTMGLFTVLLLMTATLMWRRAGVERRTDPQEQQDTSWVTWRPFSIRPWQAVVVLAVASGSGVLTGFFGVGGGFAIVPALTLIMGMPMTYAVGTSLLVITINSATGLLGRLGTEVQLDWTLIGVFTAGAVAGTLLGGTIARRLHPTWSQRAFAVLLVLVAVYTGISTLLR